MLHPLEHAAILFEDVPMQPFEAILILKAPNIALPALAFPGAPEECAAVFGVDRSDEPNDAGNEGNATW